MVIFMINISTRMFPYRLDLKTKDPIELTIEITNMSATAKILSSDIIFDPELCLEKSGIKKSEYKRHGEVLPNQKIVMTYDVHPFQGAKPGRKTIKFKVKEHFNDYKYIENITEKRIEIPVI